MEMNLFSAADLSSSAAERDLLMSDLEVVAVVGGKSCVATADAEPARRPKSLWNMFLFFIAGLFGIRSLVSPSR
jgi:hypothetical protein